MNYAYACERTRLEDRLRAIDALRSAEERLRGPVMRGGAQSGAFVSVGLMLTLCGIALFCAAMLTQDFTGRYIGYAHSSAETSGLARAIPDVGQ